MTHFFAEPCPSRPAVSPAGGATSQAAGEDESGGADLGRYLDRVLRVARKHFGMEIAFVSAFDGGRRVFRNVDSDITTTIQPGGSDPLEESYCHHVVEGRLPQLIRDAQRLPAAQALPVTRSFPIGAHMSVPLHLADGRLFGTFCCFSRSPNDSLTERDLGVMQGYSELASDWIETEVRRTEQRRATQARVRDVLARQSLDMVYQPICDIFEHRTAGFEALARFVAPPDRPPNIWFDEAWRVGLGIELECNAIKQALKALPQLPTPLYVSVNISPEVLLQADLSTLLDGVPLDRIVLEVTEHAAIESYSLLSSRLAGLRERGLRLAVDDAGAGYASFRHILNLAPDIIKLDISITRDIDKDASRRALASALIAFADATSALIVAEGVETREELHALRGLGVAKIQGHLIGRPMGLAEARLQRAC